MIWAVTLAICIIVFSPRIIAYLVPGWIGLTVIGLIILWPHMPEWMHSVVVWCIGTLIGAFLCAIPLCLFLGIPLMAGTIGFAVLGLIGEGAQIIGKVWHAITSAVGAITPVHWAAGGVGVAGLVLVECWKAWRRRVPRPLADDDDDDFDDDPTDTQPVLRLAPPRLSRAERKQAERPEAEAANAAAWKAWGEGKGPRPI